jgi:hypothetical protein
MNQFDPKYMQLLIFKLENVIKKRQTVVSVARDMNVSSIMPHMDINKRMCILYNCK